MDKDTRKAVRWILGVFAALALAITGVAFYQRGAFRGEETDGVETHVAPPPQVPAPAVNRWKQAALRIEEDRGEKTGRSARVRVPAQLLHYADKRRFLAIQVAGWRE